MSTPKVIFTYKRKRLSSRSGAAHDGACPDSPSDVHTGIQQDNPKDPMVQRSDICNLTDMQRRPTELSEDSKFKELFPSGKNVSTEATLQEGHRMTAPLITFSRRLKRKVDAGSSATLGELLAKEEIHAVENSSTLEVATDGVITGNMSCQNREKMLIKESSHLGTRSSADTPVLRKTVDNKCSQDDLVVDASSGTKQSSSPLSGLDAMETADPLKNIVSRSSDDALSSCDNVCKTDEQHVLNQCLISSGDSQLTSSACSDLKTLAETAIQPTASRASLDLSCPTPVACVIDCNVIPEPELQVKESDTIQHSSAIPENRGNVTQEGHLKREEHKLLGETDIKDADSLPCGVLWLHDDPHALVAINKKPETLQLFPVHGPTNELAPTSTNLESDSRRLQQNTTYSSVCVGHLEQTLRKAPALLGLSLAMKPIYEGQTSGRGSAMHVFQDHNVGIRGFIQNPAVQAFPHQLDTGNTSTTVPRENRTNSMDRLQPGQTMWSEEELDSLWVGIRRHGLGNWHAMLLDPKLRFAPWRVARHLADQWEREEPKISSRQSERRRIPKGQLGAFMRNTLAGVHAQCERIYSLSNGQNHPHVHASSANRQGTHSSTPFNSTHTSSVMIGGDGMGLGPNRQVNHLVQEPAGTQRLFESFTEAPGTSSGARNLNNYKFPGTTPLEIQPPNGIAGPSVKNHGTPENLIVIDSDMSSEETVSDDRIIPK